MMTSPPQGPRGDRPDISASELADYTFCARSWWLKRVHGVEGMSEALSKGRSTHEAAGRLVAVAARAERVVLMIALGALAVALVALIGWLASIGLR